MRLKQGRFPWIAADGFSDSGVLRVRKAQLAFRPDPALAVRAKVFGEMPIGDMIARGMVKGIDDLWDSRLNEALCHFFGVSDIDQIEVLPHAAKKTDVMGEASPAQIAWLYRVKQIAQETSVAKYSPSAVSSCRRTNSSRF